MEVSRHFVSEQLWWTEAGAQSDAIVPWYSACSACRLDAARPPVNIPVVASLPSRWLAAVRSCATCKAFLHVARGILRNIPFCALIGATQFQILRSACDLHEALLVLRLVLGEQCSCIADVY
eukprot:scaffold1318_cov388-Prasinococcus_capsulatus_cf.AAC.21